MKSSLTDFVKESPNHSGTRKQAVDRITPHCVVGQCSIESLGEWFSKSSTKASSNYGIGADGRVGLFVPEECRSWCSSSAENDNRAITIECASDASDPYAFKPAVYDRLVDLCVDICKRYGKRKLIWLGDKEKTLTYQPASDEMILTVHRWFANKACPGAWMMERMPDLAKQVTDRLTEPEEPSSWARAACEKAIARGIVTGYGGGVYGWKDNITREQMVTILDRLGLL